MRKRKKVRQSSTLVCALSMSAPLSVDPWNPPSYDLSELNAPSFRLRGRQFHGACAPPFKFGPGIRGLMSSGHELLAIEEVEYEVHWKPLNGQDRKGVT